MATALALGVGLGAGVAQGAEVSIPSSPGTLTYTGAAGVNGVVVSLNGSGDYEFASAGGELITLDPSNDATLCTGGGTDTVTCAPGLVSALSVSLGDGDDTLTLASYADPVTFTGGGATDRLVAAAVAAGTIDLDDGAVTLSGQAADPVLSGVEEVSLTGTGGADVFDVAGWSGDGTLVGGGGVDGLVAATSPLEVDETLTLTGSSLSYGVSGQAFSLSGFSLGTLTGDDANANTLDASGFPGAVSLSGAGGNDTLLGAAGSDTLAGGAGTDRVVQAAAAQTLTDTSLSGQGTDLLSGIEEAILTGSSGPETLDASGFTAGPVTLDGGAGGDSLLGGTGADALFGRAGSDTLVGGAGSDALDGGGGVLDAAVLTGVAAVTVTNTLLTGQGSDTLTGIERVTIGGTAGADLLDGHAISNGLDLDLTGGGGDDTLLGGNGADTLQGGAGDDSVVAAGGSDRLREFLATPGTLTLTDTSLTGSLGSDTLSGLNGASLQGSSGSDLLDAGSFFSGSVELAGNAGDDILTGGSFPDILRGGPGNDTISGGAGSDRVVETATTQTTAALSNTTLSGFGTDTLTGIEQASLTGSSGPDTISVSGWTGQATIDGGTGNDSYTTSLAGAGTVQFIDQGTDPADTLTITTGATADAVEIAASQVARGAETIGLTGIELRTIDLGPGNDTATVSGGQGTILGGTGDDTVSVIATATAGLRIDGTEGSDTTAVMFGNLAGPLSIADTGTAGTDALAIDCTLGATVTATTVSLGSESVTFSGIETPPCAPAVAPPAPPPGPGPARLKCTIKGTRKADVLVGTKGRDVICGKGGNDILIGAAGNDTLIGGGGRDTIVGGNGRDEGRGGKGRDVFLLRKGGRDVAVGGAGSDRGALDRKDTGTGIERRLSKKASARFTRKVRKAAKAAKAVAKAKRNRR